MQTAPGQVHHFDPVPWRPVPRLGAAGRLPTARGHQHAVQASKLRGQGDQKYKKPQLQGRVRRRRAPLRG